MTALVALPDNQHALSGSDDKTVKLFNVDDGDVLRTFTHHTDMVGSRGAAGRPTAFASSATRTTTPPASPTTGSRPKSLNARA